MRTFVVAARGTMLQGKPPKRPLHSTTLDLSPLIYGMSPPPPASAAHAHPMHSSFPCIAHA